MRWSGPTGSDGETVSGEPTNGSGAAKYTLTLTFDPATMNLGIAGNIPNVDTALDMLARATRYYDSQLRFAQAQENMRAAAEAQRVATITQNLRRA